MQIVIMSQNSYGEMEVFYVESRKAYKYDGVLRHHMEQISRATNFGNFGIAHKILRQYEGVPINDNEKADGARAV